MFPKMSEKIRVSIGLIIEVTDELMEVNKMGEYIRMSQLVAVLLYTTIGLVFLWGSFLVVDKMTPDGKVPTP